MDYDKVAAKLDECAKANRELARLTGRDKALGRPYREAADLFQEGANAVRELQALRRALVNAILRVK